MHRGISQLSRLRSPALPRDPVADRTRPAHLSLLECDAKKPCQKKNKTTSQQNDYTNQPQQFQSSVTVVRSFRLLSPLSHTQFFGGFFRFFLTATGTWVLTSCRVSKTRTENLGRKIPCDFPAHLLLQSAQGADGEGRRGRSYLAHDSRLKIQRYRNVQHYANVLKPERKYYVLPTAR